MFPSSCHDSKLIKGGMNYWPSINGKLANHVSKNGGHKLSCEKYEHFIVSTKDQTKSIKVSLNKVESERIKQNKKNTDSNHSVCNIFA